MIRRFALSLGFIAYAGLAMAQQSAPTKDELLALNFYVQQKDEASISAEMRRLQLKYPMWQPPSDLRTLSVTSPSREIDQIYREIAGGQFDQARQTIAATRERYPEWAPPSDMTSLLEVSEGQKRLDQALAANDLEQSLQIAGSTPGLMRCNRINNAWRIGALQQAAGQPAEAFNTYAAVTKACVSSSDIVATLEKADAVSTDAQLEGLFADVAVRLPEMKPKLDPLHQRLFAGRGVEVAAAAPATAEVRADPRAQRPVEEPAPQKAAPAPAPKKAQEAAKPKQSAPQQNSGGAVDAGVDQAAKAGNWAACVARTQNATSPTVLSQRAWCQYNLDQPAEAASAFKRALGGKMSPEQIRDARYGLALSYLKMGLSEEASRIAVATNFTRTQRVDIERQILDQRGVAAYKRGDYRRSIEFFDAIQQVSGTIRRDLAIMRGYAYLNTGQREKALKEFTRLNDQLSTRESRAGLVAAQ